MALAEQLRTIFTQILTPGRVLQDIPVFVTYFVGAEGGLTTYDPVTQTMVRQEADGVVVPGVIVEPEERTIDNKDVLRSDRYFYVSDEALLNAGVDTNRLRTTKPNDRLVYRGTTYTVLQPLTDPIQAVWVLHLRRP